MRSVLVCDEASWVNGDTLFVDGAELTKRYPLVLKRVQEMPGHVWDGRRRNLAKCAMRVLTPRKAPPDNEK